MIKSVYTETKNSKRILDVKINVTFINIHV